MSIKITLEGGKYVYECSDGYNQDVYRYGEHWRAFPGDNFIAAMANRIVELEKNQIPEGSHVIREEDLYGILAQNERLCGALNQAIELLVTALHEPEQITESEIHDLRTVELEQPPTALAALKAQWQAEAGRDGFIRGYFYSRQHGFQFEEELEAAAEKYFNYITQHAKEAGDE